MSQGNMLLGKARGKMGDIVFFVRDGVQQQRPYNGNPKNPRTISQMYQRVKLASVVGFYKRQANFFRFALRKRARESYYNAFVRYNLNIAPYLTKEAAANGVQIAAPYIIADGDMPRVDVNLCSVNVSGELECRTSLSSQLTTWGDVRRAYGLLYGDMMSCVVFNRSAVSTDQARRIVVQHVFDAESDSMAIGYDMVGLNWSTMGNFKGFSVNKAYFGIADWYAAAAAVVISRNDGVVDCSFAQLKLSENAEMEYLSYTSQAQHDEAAASYGKIEEAILDPKSFEGNYVDMMPLYGNAQLISVLVGLDIKVSTEETMYYDKAKWPNIADVELDTGGVNSPLADWSVDPDTGKITVEAVATAKPEIMCTFVFYDDDMNLVTKSTLKIGTHE